MNFADFLIIGAVVVGVVFAAVYVIRRGARCGGSCGGCGHSLNCCAQQKKRQD